MPVRLTKAVKVILIACVATFVIQQTVDQFLGGNLLGWLGLIPAGFVFDLKLWQLFTYSFLHADVMHLVLNMLMLVFIGSELELAWGSARFVRYYFLCSMSGGILYLLLQTLVWKGTGLQVPMVGSSGGIYGLLMAYGLLFGERVLLFMLLFPMKAKHFVWILAGVEFFSTVFSGRGGLSSAAHLGGMFAGFAYLWIRASLQIARRNRKQGKPTRRQKKRESKHLKLVINNAKSLRGGASDDDDVNDGGPKTWH
jgi:membrane associated rhomboid family serine protease